jgi:hypothetical protein
MLDMVECLSDSVTGGNTPVAVLFWDGLACGNVVGNDRDNQSLPFDDPQKITRKEPRLHSWLVVIELIGEEVRDLHPNRTYNVMDRAPAKAMKQNPAILTLPNRKRWGAVVMGWATSGP